MMKQIADTGLIVALLCRSDPYHGWAARAFRAHAPFFTCDAVLAEVGSFLPDPCALLLLVSRGDLELDPKFRLDDGLPHVLSLAEKYSDRPMDLADACLVRMTELTARCQVWTVDRNDFTTYRRLGNRIIPCQFPPTR